MNNHTRPGAVKKIFRQDLLRKKKKKKYLQTTIIELPWDSSPRHYSNLKEVLKFFKNKRPTSALKLEYPFLPNNIYYSG